MVAMKALLSIGLLAPSVLGHGMLTRPVSRALRNALAEANMGIDGAAGDLTPLEAAGGCLGFACEWYTQWTTVPAHMKATNCESKYRTMGVNCSNGQDPSGKTITDWPCTPGMMVPWCAPGFAPVKSACGLFAGGYNQKAVDMLDLDSTPVAVWRAGSQQNISWAVTANHGGGYAYRLCRHGKEQTEECFQEGHLQFVGEFQYILADNSSLVAQVPAVRLSTGTNPPGSSWTCNPFPQEYELMPNNEMKNLPNAFGRGPFAYNTLDTVMIPANLEPGDYTLSFRWDAEQTKQVWQQCSDVRIVAASTPDPLPAPPKPPPLSNGTACTGTSVGLATADCEAWLDMYDSLDGPNWPASWNQGCASVRTDPCGCKRTWQKNIVCDFTRDFGYITEMYLLGDAPKGTLPASITNLKHLRALSLVMTNITGELPSNMGDMTDLSMIWLDHNAFLGGILPQSLSNLANISVLELHHSNFYGKLPDNIAYDKIPDCTLNGLVFDCPLPAGAQTCGAACK